MYILKITSFLLPLTLTMTSCFDHVEHVYESKIEGMDDYMKEHGDVVQFIQNVARHLKISQQPKAIACMLYHRVVEKQRKNKNESIEKYLTGTTCLYLAAKIGEEPQRIRDMVNVSYGLLHPDKEQLEIGETYWNLRDSVTTCELIVLRYLRFKVIFDTPVKYTLLFLTSLKDWCRNLKQWDESGFGQICWNMSNDVCRLPLVIKHTAEFIATVVIYIGLTLCTMDVVVEKEGKRWFEVFCPGTTEKHLQEVGCQFLSLYDGAEQ